MTTRVDTLDDLDGDSRPELLVTVLSASPARSRANQRLFLYRSGSCALMGEFEAERVIAGDTQDLGVTNVIAYAAFDAGAAECTLVAGRVIEYEFNGKRFEPAASLDCLCAHLLGAIRKPTICVAAGY